MGSNRVLRWAMLHAGVIRRSDDVLAEATSSGISAATCCNDAMELEL